MLSITSVRRGDRESHDRVLRWAMALSTVVHLIVSAAVVAIGVQGRPPESVVHMQAPAPEPVVPTHMVFLASRVTGAGGGGGGNRQPGSIRRAESAGRDQSTLRVAKPVATSGRLVDTREVPALLLDAKPLANGMFEHIGLPTGGTTLGTSTGPGSGGGVGDGVGTGIGSGRGPGFGPGSGGGVGGGVYRAGGAVTSPQLVSQVRPTYTADALDQRIQGSVVLELVVTTEGTPSEIRVIRSLDPAGLDEEAIKAVRQWKFKPGRLADVPVNVIVTVVLDFTIR